MFVFLFKEFMILFKLIYEVELHSNTHNFINRKFLNYYYKLDLS